MALASLSVFTRRSAKSALKTRNFFWSKKSSPQSESQYEQAEANKRFGQYQLVFPCAYSEKIMRVPEHIPKPSYSETGEPTESIDHPEIKTPDQIEKMRKSCKLAATILHRVPECFSTGNLTTDVINEFVHELTIKHGAYPSPLNYKHFPKSVCTSVNNVACHGIPDVRLIVPEDIITVDVTVYYEGYHGDCSKTFLMGNVDDVGQDLVKATEICLNEAIQICKPGEKFRAIGKYIEERAKSLGYTVVPAFIGHGIGHYFHGPPDIFHTRNSYMGEMQPGMTFTIEPLLTQGSPEIVILEDNWTAVTDDNARTAQCEHTILITETGAEILTLPD